MKNLAPLGLSLIAALSLAACTMNGNGGQASSSASSAAQQNENITVASPQAGDTITSPLTITGEARGMWYFEASFPVELLDANGNRVAMHYAEAQSDWMTTDFVPFTSTLIFTAPATPTGTLVLHRDNPSGLPEHAASVEIPVSFQ